MFQQSHMTCTCLIKSRMLTFIYLSSNFPLVNSYRKEITLVFEFLVSFMSCSYAVFKCLSEDHTYHTFICLPTKQETYLLYTVSTCSRYAYKTGKRFLGYSSCLFLAIYKDDMIYFPQQAGVRKTTVISGHSESVYMSRIT